MKLRVLLFASLFAAFLPLEGIAELPEPLHEILQKEDIPAQSIGILIQELGSQTPLLAHNTTTAFNPASVMKLVTTYAALQILGPDYRWKTEFYLDGKLANGTLDGDLVVKGYGDPLLVEETLFPVIRSLRQKGLQRITGKLIVDNSYFEKSQQSTAAFDNKPFRVYNANPSALMTNFQATRFTLTPLSHAGAVQIDSWPASPELIIDNDLRLVKGKCQGNHRWPRMWFTREGEQLTARFKGNYSLKCGQQDIHRAVASPAGLFYGAFYPTWKYLNGSVNGYGTGLIPENRQPFLVHHSKTLTEIIRLINKHSNNVMTKQLLLTIGAQSGTVPGTIEAGREAVKNWMQAEGIDTRGFIIDNGSGLSRDARVSVNTLSQLAQHQWQSPWMPEMLSSLSILSKDGTAKKRFKKSPLAGNMHIKTGIINHVRSMAGVFHSKTGKRYIVISLQNHPDIHQFTGTRIQNVLLEWLDKNG